MNVYLRELRSHRKALFFWCIAMIALVASSMAKYATYKSSGQSLNAMIDQFPKTIKVIFGTNGFDLTKPDGYFGVMFLYIALTISIHAVLLGAEIISKEERDRTSEFLLVRPISRHTVVTSKLLAGVTCLAVLNIVTLLSSVYFVAYFAKSQSATGYVGILMLATVFLQLIFFSIGTAVAGFNKKPKSAVSIAASILMVTFILMFLINLDDRLENLKYLSPFKYFDAKTILADGGLNQLFVFISVVIVAAMTYVTYYFYCRRDLVV